MKRLQDTVSVSRVSLPVVVAYSVAVWLLCGLFQQQLWPQLACFAMCAYLMVELNNANALIRIYSRMVSCTFLVLSCTACFMFASLKGAVAELCFVAAYLTSFRAYQDKQAVGWMYYTFLLVGVSSLLFVHIVYFLPVLWLLVAFKVQALSWRTFFASLLGLLTPYWFAAVWFVYTSDIDTPMTHFQQLTAYETPFDFEQLTDHQLAVYVFTLVLALMGTIHYIRTRYNDKIRTRLLFDCFIITDLLALLLLALQPQHYDMLMRLAIVSTSPLVGHFIALTHTRWTNMVFCIMLVVALAITASCLLMPQ